jgi:hypothetical protein
VCAGWSSGQGAAPDEDSILQIPKLQRLDWSGLSGAIALQPGTRLRVANLDMGNFSLKSDYVYSPHTPFQSVGSGVSIWPTINGAPNTTVSSGAACCRAAVDAHQQGWPCAAVHAWGCVQGSWWGTELCLSCVFTCSLWA